MVEKEKLMGAAGMLSINSIIITNNNGKKWSRTCARDQPYKIKMPSAVRTGLNPARITKSISFLQKYNTILYYQTLKVINKQYHGTGLPVDRSFFP